MPTPQKQSAPDFIPYQPSGDVPDFIPADGGQQAPVDDRNTLQKFVDDAAAPDSASTRSGRGPIANALNDFGRGATETTLQPAVHPVDTAAGLAHAFMHPVDTVTGMAKGVVNDFQQNGAAEAIPHVMGQLAGGIVTGELGGKALGAAGKMAREAVPAVGNVGEVMQKYAAGNLNRKFPPTMKETIRGNNPGRGMLEAGIGPTASKGSLATKVAGASEAVGSRIGEAVERADQNAAAPPILAKELAPQITGPIHEAIGRIEGPFGTASTEPYQTLLQKVGNKAPGARTSIFGPTAPAEIAPTDLWKSIQNLDRNTRFNADPEVESVNEVRRDIRHGLRPALESADPTIKPLSRTYSDLSSAGDAIDRSNTAFRIPHGLNAIIDSTINSVPVNTTASSALFKGGRALKNFATNAPEFLGGKGGSPPVIPFSQKPPAPIRNTPFLPASTIGNPGGEDFTTGGFPQQSQPIPPAPSRMARLPASSSAGEVEPMVGIRNDYPKLEKAFARERVPANVFNRPQTPENPLFRVMEGGEVMPQRKGLPAPAKKKP